MRILIATDAWYPQVNGVVRTLDNVARELRVSGHQVDFLTPEGQRTVGLPSYPEIRLAFLSQRHICERVGQFNPDFIHIATEGPIGFAMRRWCRQHKIPFSTAYHTRIPEYVAARLPIPGIKTAMYALLRWFHNGGRATLVPTQSIRDDLRNRGFKLVRLWTRGVDRTVFSNNYKRTERRGPGPVMVYAGRVAVEKGIEDFLKLSGPGTKVIIGDGPARTKLERDYPDVIFTGYLFKEALAQELVNADIFVFPSKTDTFGLVMIEAMACGLPVAAYPVSGPKDVVEHGLSGWLDEDLGIAVQNAQKLKRNDASERAKCFTWALAAEQFFESLVRVEAQVHNTSDIPSLEDRFRRAGV